MPHTLEINMTLKSEHT